MASQMPVVNVEFGDRPTIEFPSETAPAGLKVVELLEGNGPMVRRGDTVWSGAKTPRSIPASTVTSRPASASVSARSSRVGTRPFRGHNVGSRLVVSIPPEYGYGSRGVPQAGIGGEDTLVFVIDIISTR